MVLRPQGHLHTRRVGAHRQRLRRAVQRAQGRLDDDNPNPWNGKEIQAKGGSNIWIYVVGNEHDFGDFDTFRREVLAGYLNVSGVGTPNGLECSFDIPRTSSPAGRTPRLEAFYAIGAGGSPAMISPSTSSRASRTAMCSSSAGSRGGTGLRPQVQTLTSSPSVGFGSRAYTFVHPVTGMSVDHDLDTPRRTFTQQAGPDATKPQVQRLVDGSTTAIRPVDLRRHLHARQQMEHLNALSRKAIRWPSTP